ncbi:porin, partial [Candidatus Eisenbacteria bacterium]
LYMTFMMRTTGLVLAALVILAGTAISGKPEVNGLVQGQYEDQVGEHSRFLLRTARIGISGDLTDEVSAMVQIDAALDPIILDALIKYDLSRYALFTAGQFKIPFGFETSITRFELEAIERSLVVSHLMNNGMSAPYLRDLGLMVTGKYMAFTYDVAVVNGTGYDYTDSTGSANRLLRLGADNNDSKDIVARVGVGVPMLAGLGFSVYQGKWADHPNRDAWGLYFQVDTGRVIFQYEYIRGKGRLLEVEPQGDDGLLVQEEWQSDKFSGYYLVLGYRIRPYIEPVVKLDKLDPDWDQSDDKLTDMHYGLNFNLERKARLQVFYREGKMGDSYRNHGWLAQVSAKF